MTPKEILDLVRENDIKVVDFRFTDLPGSLQHFSIPASTLSADMFQEGLGFDGSSIRGFQEINESDMLLIPVPDTAYRDPFTEHATLNISCDIIEPGTRQHYGRDPRQVALRAEMYLKGTNIADTAYFGPEAEFYIFDDVRYDQTPYSGYYRVDSVEGIWNSGAEEAPNLGYKIPYKRGYFPVPPSDSLQDLRTEMMLTLIECGVDVEVQHHEVGTAGQAEIDMRFDTLTRMADKLQTYKYVIKNVARQNERTVTFMPKPLFQDNGSGMHVHQSLWKGSEPLFADAKGYAGLSEMAVHYIGGILKHAPALLAFCAPTTNSYRRLVPGYEAPINLIYSQRNRSACVRIPMYSSSPKAKRIEFRAPDPSANPYLAFAALLMAGIDGIENRIQPPTPVDKNVYDLPAAERKGIQQTPGSLDEVLAALSEDHEFLLKGGVFTHDLIKTWIEYKTEAELKQVALRPHPYEFALYYDI
ncbi:MAG: type I glutamate--ammonia ligase [Armatimonadetes bacterium]|nr:type I glutamate--ammonia ligase [Armatimonadota bacterium]MDE2207327.1 type I glutamate--ammonia ligase [Armatimonadota bacterium]